MVDTVLSQKPRRLQRFRNESSISYRIVMLPCAIPPAFPRPGYKSSPGERERDQRRRKNRHTIGNQLAARQRAGARCVCEVRATVPVRAWWVRFYTSPLLITAGVTDRSSASNEAAAGVTPAALTLSLIHI